MNRDTINISFILFPKHPGLHHLGRCETQHCDVSDLPNRSLLITLHSQPDNHIYIRCTESHVAISKKRVCNYVHPKQHSPFPDRLKLPYPDEEILSGYEEDVSFIRDGFTAWVSADFETILERHAVDIRKAHAEFREASARKHDTSYQEYHFDNNVPNRSPVQKGSASTTGTQDPDVEEKALPRSKSQGNGTSLPCRSRLSMLTTSFPRIGST